MRLPACEFGVVITGNELLSGKRRDRHLPHVIDILHARGQSVGWCRIVGDDRSQLVRTLQETRHAGMPVFCFGGIGATPDDLTRQAAAEAFNTRLARNPEAVSMIEAQFGEQAWPNRIRMADLPVGCTLIPNPCNRIPGFTLGDHHFLPGFPQMAWPMLDWVVQHYYPALYELNEERCVRVLDASESELLGIMDRLADRHAAANLFSLPRLAERNSIEIGFRGRRAVIDAAFNDLQSALKARSLVFEVLPVQAS